VLYVDIDPMVRACVAELLADDGTAAVITADLRDPRSRDR
jgi:S-adenosyl methyltransferase